MAVTARVAVGGAAVGGAATPSLRLFARLKLRMLANGFRGQTWRVVLFVLGGLAGLWFAGVGFLVTTLSGLDDPPELAVLIPAFGGATLVFGWLFIPLVWAGVDETLDPARFALLPLSRRTLVGGLLVAALLGVPAMVTLLASSGLIVGAAQRGGVAAALAELIGVGLGLLLCVTLSRAVTSAFASLLRARRTRDLAAVMLALLAALLGPLQIAIIVALQHAKIDQVVRIARVLGWTPLAAPYLLGSDAADGAYGAAAGRLVIGAGTVALLLWWWSRSLESAMVGAVSGGTARARRELAGGPVAQLFPRPLAGLPRTPYGALVAREARYWWRDARRRASLITLGVVGVFVPLTTSFSSSYGGGPPSPALVTWTMLFVGSLAAVTLANQFGMDGTAYAANVIAAVPGRVELRARVVAYSLYALPLLVVVATLGAFVTGQPARLTAMLGGLLAVYGTGLAVNLFVSILGAYALPETSNPFAVNTGAGLTKSLLAFLGMVSAIAAAAPVAVAAILVGGFWSWLALPVGVAYGLGAVALGVYLAGDLLDRRAPELLTAISPARS